MVDMVDAAENSDHIYDGSGSLLISRHISHGLKLYQHKFYMQSRVAILAESPNCNLVDFFGGCCGYDWTTENRCHISGSLESSAVDTDYPHRFCQRLTHGPVRLILEENRHEGVSGSLTDQQAIGKIERTTSLYWYAKNGEGCTSDAHCSRFLIGHGINEEGCTSSARFYRARQAISSRWLARNIEGCTSDVSSYQSVNGRGINAEGCTSGERFYKFQQVKDNRTSRANTRYNGECHGSVDRLLQLLWYLLALQSTGLTYLRFLQWGIGVMARLCFLRFERDHAQIGSELIWQLTRGSFWMAATMFGLNRLRQPHQRHFQVVGRRRYSL